MSHLESLPGEDDPETGVPEGIVGPPTSVEPLVFDPVQASTDKTDEELKDRGEAVSVNIRPVSEKRVPPTFPKQVFSDTPSFPGQSMTPSIRVKKVKTHLLYLDNPDHLATLDTILTEASIPMAKTKLEEDYYMEGTRPLVFVKVFTLEFEQIASEDGLY
jgi:hypothetical protein